MKDFWYVLILLFSVPAIAILGLSEILFRFIDCMSENRLGKYLKPLGARFFWLDAITPFVVWFVWGHCLHVFPYGTDFDDIGEFAILGSIWSLLLLIRHFIVSKYAVRMILMSLLTSLLMVLTAVAFFLYRVIAR